MDDLATEDYPTFLDIIFRNHFHHLRWSILVVFWRLLIIREVLYDALCEAVCHFLVRLPSLARSLWTIVVAAGMGWVTAWRLLASAWKSKDLSKHTVCLVVFLLVLHSLFIILAPLYVFWEAALDFALVFWRNIDDINEDIFSLCFLIPQVVSTVLGLGIGLFIYLTPAIGFFLLLDPYHAGQLLVLEALILVTHGFLSFQPT